MIVGLHRRHQQIATRRPLDPPNLNHIQKYIGDFRGSALETQAYISIEEHDEGDLAGKIESYSTSYRTQVDGNCVFVQ